MTDVIPAQLLNATFGKPSSGTYNNYTGVWSGLSLSTGNSVTITLGRTITPAATGSITNAISVAVPTESQIQSYQTTMQVILIY